MNIEEHSSNAGLYNIHLENSKSSRTVIKGNTL